MIDRSAYQSSRLCPICKAKIVEKQPIAICPSCNVVMHVPCAEYVDLKCPMCKTRLVVQPGTVQVTVSGSNAEEVGSIARSLLNQIQRLGSTIMPRSDNRESSQTDESKSRTTGVDFGQGSDFSGATIKGVAGRDIIAKGISNPKDRRSLREWWHEILREYDRYPCYGIFLVLPSDAEAIRYLNEFGQELDLISGENCSVIALSSTEVRRSSFDEDLWNTTLEKHVSEGHSLKVAQLFDIEITTFPCLVLFRDIRSPEHVVITLKGMKAEEICEKMRLVFAVIRKAVSTRENPLVALEQHRSQENLRKMGQSIIGQTRIVAGKTFETAMEAWIKAVIK